MPMLEFWGGLPNGSGGITSDKFTVDMEYAPQLIKDLQAAIEEAHSINADARQLREVEAPGGDPYSADAIKEINRRASDEDGCHGQANRVYREAIQHTINSIQASLDAYRQAEERNTARHKGA